MATPLQVHGRPYFEEPSFDLNKATPPDQQIQLPLTPPATCEQLSHGSNASAVDSALQIIRRYQRQDFELEASWMLIPLTPVQYEDLLLRVEDDPVLYAYVENDIRLDYDPVHMLLIARMPTPVHDIFAAFITQEIIEQLQVLSQCANSSADFAARIYSAGCARIFLKDDDDPAGDAQGRRVLHKREPDGQFQHQDALYPGIILEISYAQDGKDLEKLAWDYIQCSNGDIKTVIGIDIKYGKTKEATLSVWRPWSNSEKSSNLFHRSLKQVLSYDLGEIILKENIQGRLALPGNISWQYIFHRRMLLGVCFS